MYQDLLVFCGMVGTLGIGFVVGFMVGYDQKDDQK